MNQPVQELRELLHGIEPDRIGLMTALRELLDDSIIKEIARADYGADLERHQEALARIWHTGEVETPINWHPLEVLQLTAWSRPADRRGHTARAFVCAVLLHNADRHGGGENQRVATLIESVIAIWGDSADSTLQFLVWCLGSTAVETDDERLMYALGILCLRVWLRNDGAQTVELARWIEREADRLGVEQERLGCKQAKYWLMGLASFNMRHDTWLRLVQQILERESSLRVPGAASTVEHLAKRIVNRAPKRLFISES